AADLPAARSLPTLPGGRKRLVPDPASLADVNGLRAYVAAEHDTLADHLLDLRFAGFELTPERVTEMADAIGLGVVLDAEDVSQVPAHGYALAEDGKRLDGSGIALAYVVPPQVTPGGVSGPESSPDVSDADSRSVTEPPSRSATPLSA